MIKYFKYLLSALLPLSTILTCPPGHWRKPLDTQHPATAHPKCHQQIFLFLEYRYDGGNLLLKTTPVALCLANKAPFLDLPPKGLHRLSPIAPASLISHGQPYISCPPKPFSLCFPFLLSPIPCAGMIFTDHHHRLYKAFPWPSFDYPRELI